MMGFDDVMDSLDAVAAQGSKVAMFREEVCGRGIGERRDQKLLPSMEVV